MVTLLFALFLVLFAVASVDNTRLLELAIALDQRLKQQEPTKTDTERPAQELVRESPREAALERLAQYLSQYSTKRTENGVSVSLASDGILFDSGAASLKSESEEVLQEFLSVLEDKAISVTIEGHTDAEPISTEEFKSNWELSLMRAWAVAEYFRLGKVEPSRLSVMGFAHTRPVASNKTPLGRAQNRRVVINFILASESTKSSAMDPIGEQIEFYGPRLHTGERNGTTSIGTTDPSNADAVGVGSNNFGLDDLFYSDSCCLGPYPAGFGHTEHPSQHRPNPTGLVPHSSVDGTNS